MSEATSALAQRVAEVFGPEGRLSTVLGQYEFRPQQQQMAEMVTDAFDNGERVIIEAGTGTGKTLGYLIPAILSGQHTIVSTATKTLQEQIFLKDIPLLRKVLPRGFRAEYLKGRQNYLCLWQMQSFQLVPRFRREADQRQWPMIEKWYEHTTTGDRGEMPDLPEDWPTWAELTVGSDTCLGQKCPRYGDCFVVRARQRAAEADVVIVNHHLFFADLALREREKAELLPDYNAVIFDEAHNLEEMAGNLFGMSVSSWRIMDLCTDIRTFLERENLLDESMDRKVEETLGAMQRFVVELSRHIEGSDGRVDWAELIAKPTVALGMDDAWKDLSRSLSRTEDHLEAMADRAEVIPRLVERCKQLQEEFGILVGREAADLVYVAEKRGRGVFLHGYPVDLQPIFNRLLYRTCKTQIYTSATLSTDQNFSFFKRRMGMPSDTRELALSPVFDYMQQAILYVPSNLPEPNDPKFIDRVAPHIEELIRITEGKAFVLFTSYRNMYRAFELLGPKIRQQVLLQGEKSRGAILEAFRRDRDSVLFATSSFWEGVDVQGEALSLVIIDKLPFASPGDPLVRARMDHIQKRGGNPFGEFQVPQAAIALKQGIGRLIRHRNDTGIVAVLDSRLIHASYGKRFLESIPRTRRTQDVELVRRWWQSRGSSGDD